MDYVQSLSGNTTPLRLPVQIGEAMATKGVPVVIGGAGNEGVALAATTTAADLVGVTIDAQATLVTAQQTDNSDPAREVTVICDPQAVYKARCNGGATAGTALPLFTVDTAAADGLTVETTSATTGYDEGIVFGYTGANAGIGRKVTSVTGNHFTVTVAFPFDVAVGDTFIASKICGLPFSMEDDFVELTSNLAQADLVTASPATTTFRPLRFILLDKADDPDRLQNEVFMVPYDSIWAGGGSI